MTQSGLKAVDAAMAAVRAAYDATQQIEGLNERRSAVAAASRDTRYFVERLRISELMPDPVARDMVTLGSVATFVGDDGRRMTYRILEADSRAGSISYGSPVARALIGNPRAGAILCWFKDYDDDDRGSDWRPDGHDLARTAFSRPWLGC